jgi:aminomethyltransferase
LMFVNRGDDIFVVVNGACKVADIAHIQARIGQRCEVIPLPDLALLALQGPQAVTALSQLVPGVEKLVFMSGQSFDWQGVSLFITRSGYTGEDGFEISVPNAHATELANALLQHSAVQSIGLGARNSLRLEAGLCLYGQDIDTNTTPVEAGLNWAIQKVRRTGGARAGGFPGADKILSQLDTPQTLTQQRVGLIAQERVPVREHVEIHNASGQRIGEVTSGLLAPTVDQPIAMAYLPPSDAVIGHTVYASVRGKAVPMVVSPMPFHPTRYYRG